MATEEGADLSFLCIQDQRRAWLGTDREEVGWSVGFSSGPLCSAGLETAGSVPPETRLAI